MSGLALIWFHVLLIVGSLLTSIFVGTAFIYLRDNAAFCKHRLRSSGVYQKAGHVVAHPFRLFRFRYSHPSFTHERQHSTRSA